MTENRLFLFNGHCEYIEGTLTTPRACKYWLVIADTQYISFVMSSPNSSGYIIPETTSSFAKRLGTDVAINGDEYFVLSAGFLAKGRAMTALTKYGVQTEGITASFSKSVPYQMSMSWAGYASYAYNAISGSKQLLVNGQRGNFTDDLPPAPRTALGWNANASKLLLFVVDGRQTQSMGLTLGELSSLLRYYGATDAINLDGGGSTAMVVNRNGVQTLVNNPSDGLERQVANKVGIKFLGGETPMGDYWEIKNNDSAKTRTIRTSYIVTSSPIAEWYKLYYGTIGKAGTLPEDKYTYTSNKYDGAGTLIAKAGDIWLKMYENDGHTVSGWIAEIHVGTVMITKTLKTEVVPPPVTEVVFEPFELWYTDVDGVRKSQRFIPE